MGEGGGKGEEADFRIRCRVESWAAEEHIQVCHSTTDSLANFKFAIAQLIPATAAGCRGHGRRRTAETAHGRAAMGSALGQRKGAIVGTTARVGMGAARLRELAKRNLVQQVLLFGPWHGCTPRLGPFSVLELFVVRVYDPSSFAHPAR